jgi:hypothetical protein
MNPRTRSCWDERLFAVLWLWIAFRTILPWLVTFRLTLEGAGYSWGSEYFGHMFHSSGLARPDFLLVYVMLIIGVFLIFKLRQHRFRLAVPLVLVYLGFFAANGLHQLVRGEPVIFRGDTLDVTLNVTVVYFVLQFGMFLVGLAWWYGVRHLDNGPGTPPLSAKRRAILKVCLAAIPVQIILLVVGEPHALTDEIGVLLTLANWLVLMWVFYPNTHYRAVEQESPVSAKNQFGRE